MSNRESSVLAGVVVLVVWFVPLLLAKAQQPMLLVPDSTNQRVVAVSPVDGSVLSANLILDPSHLSTPKNAIDSGRGTILISDQVRNAVYEYDWDGHYLGTIAEEADGIFNVRGIAVRESILYVTVGQGINLNTIQTFDLNGNALGTWTNTGLNAPFDLYFRQNDALVTNAIDHTIRRYDLNGNDLGIFHFGSIRFPQQINQRANGNLLVTGFSLPSGIYEYDPHGNEVAYYPGGTLLRGVYELDNGLLLFTDNNSLSTYNPATGQVVDILTNGSFQYVELAVKPRRPGDVNNDDCVDDADLSAVIFAFGQTGSGLPEDLNGDQSVDDADLAEVIFNFGNGC